MCLCAPTLSVAGCTAERDAAGVSQEESDLAAVEIWAHPDSVGMTVYTPLDFKAASRNVVWAIDRIAAGVLLYEPLEGVHGAFGVQEHPPAQVVSPARLAVGENIGVFVFDDSTGMVDLYSPGGQHLRGFDPGLRPSILEVSHRPLRLTYGVRTFATDSIPTLTIVQTDFLGHNPDTLLSREAGPETLRDAPAVGGRLITAPSASGLWVFSRAVSDTVFEVSGFGPSRKLVLPEADTLRAGILADLQQEILWVAAVRPRGGLEYEAYDISGSGSEDQIIDGTRTYLGTRTTPLHFVAKAAFDGSVSGWWRGENEIFSPRGYDMRVEELRNGAQSAWAERAPRRAASAREWEVILRAAAAAREAALGDDEAVGSEEDLGEEVPGELEDPD